MQISTSILNSNNREESVKKLNFTKTKYIHIDVMDGIFVSNTEFSIEEIKKINNISKKKLDIHLMVENPISYIEKLNNLNIKYITFHSEVEKDINSIIEEIKSLGYKVGLAIKPNTKVKEIVNYLSKIDLILVMSVEPGKGGQQFIENTIDKVKELRKIIDNNKYKAQIEVDGGINNEIIKRIKEANISVVGSYITKSDNYKEQINKLL